MWVSRENSILSQLFLEPCCGVLPKLYLKKPLEVRFPVDNPHRLFLFDSNNDKLCKCNELIPVDLVRNASPPHVTTSYSKHSNFKSSKKGTGKGQVKRETWGDIMYRAYYQLRKSVNRKSISVAPLSTVSVIEFYRQLSFLLTGDRPHRKDWWVTLYSILPPTKTFY